MFLFFYLYLYFGFGLGLWWTCLLRINIIGCIFTVYTSVYNTYTLVHVFKGICVASIGNVIMFLLFVCRIYILVAAGGKVELRVRGWGRRNGGVQRWEVKSVFNPMGDNCNAPNSKENFSTFSEYTRHWKKIHIKEIVVYECQMCNIRFRKNMPIQCIGMSNVGLLRYMSITTH